MTYYSIVEARGTGGAMTLATPPYLRKEHISVYIDGVPTSMFTWVGDAAVSIPSVPLNRLVRVVRRTSPGVLLTDYKDGTQLPGATLTVDSKQAFYMAQEALDMALIGGGTAGGTVPPGIELSQGGIKDLLNGQITPSELELSLREEIERISGPEDVVGTVAWKILQEAIARTAAIQEEAAARAAALLLEARERGAAITMETEARQSAVESLASQLTTLTASTGAAVAALQSKQQALVDESGALASQLTTLAAETASTAAAIVTESNARSSADNAIASAVEAIRADLETADASLHASITSEQTARVTADAALASRITSLEASAGGGGGGEGGGPIPPELTARITAVEQALADETSARAISISNMEAAYKSEDTAIKASVTAANQARVDGDNALASRAAVLEARVDPSAIPEGKTVLSLIADEATTRSAADATNAQAIQSVQSSIVGPGGVGDRLAAVETKATTAAEELGTVKANYTLKVQARSDGKLAVAGIGLSATSSDSAPTQSEMVFMADKFTFVPSASQVDYVPQPLLFMGVVDGVSTLVIPKGRIGDKLIESRMVLDGTLEARHIKAGSITADRIDTRGLTIRDAAGNLIFGSGTALSSAYITPSPSWLNSNVTLSGLGYTGATNATYGATWNGTISGQPSDSSISNNQIGINAAGQFYGGGAGTGTTVSNNQLSLSNSGTLYNGGTPQGQMTTLPAQDTRYTNQLPWQYPMGLSQEFKQRTSIGAPGNATYGILITERPWSDASGGATTQTFKSDDGEWKRLSLGSHEWQAWQPKLDRQLTAANVSTYIAAAAIGYAEVGVLRAQNFTVGAMSDVVSGGTSSGGRIEISNNRIRVFDSSNALRVKLGYLL
ncbi:MAG: DUF1983 domain-containing protein [Comamonadaceae bacterium]|nr:DUF1983 domain-containing protein [Comamonadaceae bacterium]